jgi:hypothetical protein
VLETVKLPASISDLNTGLTDVDRNALSHFRCKEKEILRKEEEIEEINKLTEALTVKRRRLSRRLLSENPGMKRLI